MALSADNYRANLRTAARNVAARLGVDPANLTHDRRRAYNRDLAAEILRYPDSFSADILAIARRIRDHGSLEEFGVLDVLDAAGSAVAPRLDALGNKLLWAVIAVAVALVVLNWPRGGPRTA